MMNHRKFLPPKLTVYECSLVALAPAKAGFWAVDSHRWAAGLAGGTKLAESKGVWAEPDRALPSETLEAASTSVALPRAKVVPATAGVACGGVGHPRNEGTVVAHPRKERTVVGPQ